MKRREIWGSALIVSASMCAWADTVINEAFWAAARQDLLLYASIRGDSIAAWFRIVALFLAASGLLLLLPALIGRVQRKVPRRIIGWTTTVAAAAASPFICIILLFTLLSAIGIGDTVKVTAADGQSVLITQDGPHGPGLRTRTAGSTTPTTSYSSSAGMQPWRLSRMSRAGDDSV